MSRITTLYSGRVRVFRTLIWPNIAAAMVLAASALVPTGIARAEEQPVPPPVVPYKDPTRPVEIRVQDLLSRMTLQEKVGQMLTVERSEVVRNPQVITDLRLGSVFSGGSSNPSPNTASGWADTVDSLQRRALATRLQIPILYGVNSVHGFGNLPTATIFPHNIGMGATRDPDLVRRTAAITASETRAAGPQWAFAPCLCVARDDRWGRTYESYGETPELVSAMSVSILGLQGPPGGTSLASRDHVLATAKHYAGDGDTEYGTSKTATYTLDQGTTITSRGAFRSVDEAPYIPAINSYGVGSIMTSYSSIDWTEDGVGNPIKMLANRELLTDNLKGSRDFRGFIVTDWEAIRQLPGTWPQQVRTAINAGADMAMEPDDFEAFATTLTAEVQAGRVSRSRIDDAVRRILTAKFRLGLFEKPYTDRTNARSIGSPAHRAVAREAVAKSQVLLKNSGGLLPLTGYERIYVAGSGANDMGRQSGGWTRSWQGAAGPTIPGTTILAGIRAVAPHAKVTFSRDASAPRSGNDVGIVVIGEYPYAEGIGDVGNGRSMHLTTTDRNAVDRVCGSIDKCILLVASGRPMILTDVVGKADAVVATWLPGAEGAGVADVLFGDRSFTGRLPVSWPKWQSSEPINVGDARYDPMWAYDFGLHTARTSCSEGAFKASYFSGVSLESIPTVVRCENSIDHDWAGGSPDARLPADNFAARWEAKWRLPAGVYDFKVSADDGVRLWIDGALVLDEFHDQPTTTYVVRKSLSSGTHSVRMDYYEHAGLATAQLALSRALR